MANTNLINDTGWGFPPEFRNNGSDTRMVSYEDEIREALEIMFTTLPGERIAYPSFGCDLNQFLFEDTFQSDNGIFVFNLLKSDSEEIRIEEDSEGSA